MNTYKLLQLLNKYEGPKLDFKEDLKIGTSSDKKEFAKDVIAIANSSGGRGYIVFGVEDKSKKIVGINPEAFNEEQIQQIISARVDPPIAIAVDILEFKGKSIAVLSIFKSYHAPHQMLQTGAFYIRRGSTTDLARREEIASMLQMNGLFSYELTEVKNASMDDFDEEVLHEYLSKLGICSDNPSKILLESLGIIRIDERSGKYSPTVGGLLLFGKQPSKFLPHSFIKIIYNSTVQYLDDNIFTMLKKAECYFKSVLSESYPIETLMQALSNAIVHRDYTDVGRGIVVEITDTNIVINNPGALLPGNILYNIEKDNNPRKRNLWLYQRLMITGDEKKSLKEGIGIARIKKEFSNAKFLNIGYQNLFKVILPR